MSALVHDLHTALLGYKDSIEILIWILGVSGIAIAIGQLSEARKQRGLTESFALSEKLEDRIQAFAACAQAKRRKNDDFTRALAAVLSVCEIVADGINQRHLTRMSERILSNQVLDSLPIVFEYQGVDDCYRYLCVHDGVCSALKIFLLRHPERVRASPELVRTMATMFAKSSQLFSAGMAAGIRRHVEIIRLNRLN